MIRADAAGMLPRPASRTVALCRAMLGGSRLDRLLRWSVSHGLPLLAWRAIEKVAAPGLTQHFLRRKAWIERQCRESIAEGFSQLLVIGAGLDTLSLRLCEAQALARAVEVDHPATQQLKQLVPNRPSSLTLVPADLAHTPLLAALGSASLTNRPTIVVIEGLLMYLTQDQVTNLLQQVAKLPVPRVRLIATVFERTPGRPLGFRAGNWLAERWVNWRGEPFKWGATRADAAALFTAAGFTLREWVDEPALAREWPGTMLEGEVEVVADLMV